MTSQKDKCWHSTAIRLWNSSVLCLLNNVVSFLYLPRELNRMRNTPWGNIPKEIVVYYLQQYYIWPMIYMTRELPWWSCGKESAYNAGDLGLMPPEPAMRPSPPSPLPQSSSVSFTSESTSRHLWSFVVFPKCNFSPFSRSCINILKALWVFL